jgi:hypothetical protein
MSKLLALDVEPLFTSGVHLPEVPMETWIDLEGEIGSSLPSDFKRLVEIGKGRQVGHCYLRHPAASNGEPFSLSVRSLQKIYAEFGSKAKSEIGVSYFPEPDGLIQLAYMDLEHFMIRPDGDDICIVSFSGWEIIETGRPISQLLWDCYHDRSLFDGLGGAIWTQSSETNEWSQQMKLFEEMMRGMNPPI